MRIEDLRVQNRVSPLGIDVEKPAFSWTVATKQNEWKQLNYRIQVFRSADCIWDSGTVESDQMTGVTFAGWPLVSDCRYMWRLTVSGGKTKETASAESWFETGLFSADDWNGCFLGEADQDYHVFRKVFRVSENVLRARLYICGLGQQVCNINGKPVTSAVLEPGWTDYRKTCFYSCYDISKLIYRGSNAISVRLGDGMYNVRGGRYAYYPRSYGNRKFLLQMNLTLEDGSMAKIVSDPSWHMAPGPIRFCCIYGGEDFDARMDRAGCSKPDYNEDETWIPAYKAESPEARLVASPLEPIIVKETIEPVTIKQSLPGVWLYDFGKNFSGWARIQVKRGTAPAGTRITMTPGELLNSEGRPDQRVTGKGYAWSYWLNAENVQMFAPDFTYTGFRYLEVQGAVPEGESADPDIPRLLRVTGEFIFPDVRRDGSFSCGNQLWDRIHEIVVRAAESNMKSYLTDCPHRERLPWLEQTHLIAPGVMYNFDVQNLYEKQEQDMEDAQHDDGLVPDICPEYVKFGFHRGFVDSPEWGSACILNPWYLYERYGNMNCMRRHYAMMHRYIVYLKSRTWHGVLHHGLGDWLDIGPNKPWSQNTPVPVVATCVYYLDLRVMERVAHLLDKPEDAGKYRKEAEHVFKEYNRQFLDGQTGRYATGSQAAQAMSLAVGLVPEKYREQVLKKLREDIIHRNYAVTAGDIGHPFLIAASLPYGYSDLIDRMLRDTEKPGYGYMVANGATTLTEEWDGPDPAGPHGSQNHFMLGGIEEWFYGALGGIRLIHGNIPFGEVRIEPYVPGDLSYCDVSLRHPYGMLRVHWTQDRWKINFHIAVPPNLTVHFKFGKICRMLASGSWDIVSDKAGEESNEVSAL